MQIGFSPFWYPAHWVDLDKGPLNTCCSAYLQQEAFEKCWAHSLLRAVLHSPGVGTAATVARRLHIDVHDDNDNAWRDSYGPMEWAQ